ncbi:hypothetical protein [Pseudonocardia lacus]|uniref:hypothetical protein n=1 Tax=Pseudonocardia lacus TaxID=2835865 RepID=UPI001BDBB524|nr:hypothetical protein [Pseudonocardia lacus]
MDSTQRTAGADRPGITAALGQARRYVDAAVMVISGAFFIAAKDFSPSISPFWAVALGVGLIGYGAYIALSGRAYWMYDLLYVIPIFLFFFYVIG